MVLNNCLRSILWMILRGARGCRAEIGKEKPPVEGRLSRKGLTNPCPWSALEVGVLGRLK